ncbi:MAG: tetratricopeptide repeat protein [Desulfobacteraceae bacterium]|nr:tetratricopeptide repeat protein [Desulfobacteraceae bacterium]
MRGQEFFDEGQRLFMSGRIRESIDQFTQALAAGHDEVPVRLSRGAAYLNIQELDKALADLDAVLAKDPGNERAHYYRGIVLLNKEEFERAATDFDRTIAQNPQRGPAFLGRALALSESGREEEALRDFKTAVAHSTVEVERFVHSFGNARAKFAQTMALLEGERGPLRQVMTPEEVAKLQQWMEPEK